jgi:hypothetical protein
MTPDLVIAVAAKGECDPVPFLRTLTAQIEASDSLRVEVRVAHDRPGSATHQFPAVDFVACDVGTPLQHLWGAALTGVAATYIAILDIACPPARGWLPAVAVSIRSGLPFAWGPVMPSPSLGKLGLLAYLAEYCQFHRPISRRLNEIPGNNVVFERTLLRGRVDLECNGFEKTFFVWRLADDGVPMTCNEQMLIQFNKEIEWWSYVRRLALHGRCFAARRM